MKVLPREKYIYTNIGKDVWNCWEVSTLLNNGCPFNGVLRLSYDSNSKSTLDPKSLSEYISSFKMKMLGENLDEAALAFESQVKEDLTSALKEGIDCILHTQENII